MYVNAFNANLYKLYACNTIHVSAVGANLYKLYACNIRHVSAVDANYNDDFHTYMHV